MTIAVPSVAVYFAILGLLTASAWLLLVVLPRQLFSPLSSGGATPQGEWGALPEEVALPRPPNPTNYPNRRSDDSALTVDVSPEEFRVMCAMMSDLVTTENAGRKRPLTKVEAILQMRELWKRVTPANDETPAPANDKTPAPGRGAEEP